MQNLQRQFQETVALCKNCLLAKKRTELEQYNHLCKECYEEAQPPTLPPKLEQNLPDLPPPQPQATTSLPELFPAHWEACRILPRCT